MKNRFLMNRNWVHVIIIRIKSIIWIWQALFGEKTRLDAFQLIRSMRLALENIGWILVNLSRKINNRVILSLLLSEHTFNRCITRLIWAKLLGKEMWIISSQRIRLQVNMMSIEVLFISSKNRFRFSFLDQLFKDFQMICPNQMKSPDHQVFTTWILRLGRTYLSTRECMDLIQNQPEIQTFWV